MAWAKVDDKFHAHPKAGAALALEPLSLAMWVMSLSYACQQMDGFVPAWFVEQKFPKRPSRERAIRALVSTGLWDAVDGGWCFHDYRHYNPPERHNGRLARKRLYADQKLVAAVRARDGDYCRYCGEPVEPNDHRSPRGRTLDHVDPDGPSTIENVVVSCRGCEARKIGLTPENAAMTLLSAPGKQLALNS